MPEAEVKRGFASYLQNIRISDLEAIRMVLSGDSVIDWFRLNFTTVAEVDQFLSVNGYDTSNITDIRRLQRIRDHAAVYLHDMFGHEVPTGLLDTAYPITDLFLAASGSRRRTVDQETTCLLLKLMHTIHHLDARELQHRCDLSEAELYKVVSQRVKAGIDIMRREGFHIVDHYGSHKDKTSTITKLLAKKENHAAAIYDKIRFRIITRTKSDILSVLYFLGRTICPFNYVIPGASHNNLLAFEDMVAQFERFSHYARYVRGKAEIARTKAMDNPFTSDSYRVINFVSDIPIRVDEMVYTPDFIELGRIIFVPVEFQVLDLETHKKNEMGEGSHSEYKGRQIDAVRGRLGL